MQTGLLYKGKGMQSYLRNICQAWWQRKHLGRGTSACNASKGSTRQNVQAQRRGTVEFLALYAFQERYTLSRNSMHVHARAVPVQVILATRVAPNHVFLACWLNA